MGALVKAMKKYGLEWTLDKNLTPDRMKKWFGDKVATQRSLKAMSFTKRSAVVIVGVSGIGKTTFMKKFVKTFPSFKTICYDECYVEAMNEMKCDDDITQMRMLEIVERRLRKYKNGNIIIDGNFLHPGTRAALYEVLNNVYGYEVHAVYFGMKYIEENFPIFAYNRAVQLVLFREYLDSLTEDEKKTVDITELDDVRENIIEITAVKRNVSVEDLCEEYAKRKDVIERVEELFTNLMNEMKSNNLYVQYVSQFFYYGADYFYEI